MFFFLGECRKLVSDLQCTKKQLDEVKSQLTIAEYSKEKDLEDNSRRAQEEIQSLQQLVHETIEENTMSNSEIKRLADDNERYRLENIELRESLAAQQVNFNNYFVTNGFPRGRCEFL